MAHRCRSSQYSNMRPRYVLGRTIPEAAGIAGGAALGYAMFQLTTGMTYAGQAGKIHLLLIFAAVALPIIVGFVFFMDGAEPYPRQVVGYLGRRTVAAVRRGPARLGVRAHGTAARISPASPAISARPSTRGAEATDLTGRLLACLRRSQPAATEEAS